MKKSFESLQEKALDLQYIIEDVANILPDSLPKNFKIKKKLENTWMQFNRAMMRHEMMITDAVPAIKISLDEKTKFAKVWKLYCDYMQEQHGTRMGSRMQDARLKLLFEYTNNNIESATRYLNYYMANGSANIYKIIDQNGQEQQHSHKAKFSIS